MIVVSEVMKRRGNVENAEEFTGKSSFPIGMICICPASTALRSLLGRLPGSIQAGLQGIDALQLFLDQSTDQLHSRKEVSGYWTDRCWGDVLLDLEHNPPLVRHCRV